MRIRIGTGIPAIRPGDAAAAGVACLRLASAAANIRVRRGLFSRTVLGVVAGAAHSRRTLGILGVLGPMRVVVVGELLNETIASDQTPYPAPEHFEFRCTQTQSSLVRVRLVHMVDECGSMKVCGPMHIQFAGCTPEALSDLKQKSALARDLWQKQTKVNRRNSPYFHIEHSRSTGPFTSILTLPEIRSLRANGGLIETLAKLIKLDDQTLGISRSVESGTSRHTH